MTVSHVPSHLVGPPAPAARQLTLCGALEEAARSAHGVAFVDLTEHEERLTWAEILEQAREVAVGLHARGVRPGDRVGLLMRTSPEFLTVYYGALLARAVPVPLYPPVRLGRLADYHRATAAMLTRVEARLVVSASPLSRLLGSTLEQARTPLGLALAGELRRAGAPPPPVGAIDPDDLALIQFSSGSTVDPKPVCLTHRQLQLHVAALHALVQPTAADLYVSWLPLYHDMGLIGALFATVGYPGPLVLLPPENFLAKPILWLRALSRHRGTVSGAPNFAYGLCLKRLGEADLQGLDLSAWRVAFNGAEPISADVARRFLARLGTVGLRPEAMRPVYGLSEAALALTFPPARSELATVRAAADALAERGELVPGTLPSARELVAVGGPIPGVELSLRDGTGAEVPVGRVGHIFARGPSVFERYCGDPEATSRTLVDGWLDTGDLGLLFRDELHLVGRAKDLIILRGANHPPQVFEDCLEGLPGLRAGCAVALGFSPPEAVPDEQGEQLLILAEWDLPPEDPTALIAAIREAILSRTAIRPHTVELLSPGTLPRTSSGKLRRSEALRLYQSAALTAPAPVTPLRLAGAVIKSALAYARHALARD